MLQQQTSPSTRPSTLRGSRARRARRAAGLVLVADVLSCIFRRIRGRVL